MLRAAYAAALTWDRQINGILLFYLDWATHCGEGRCIWFSSRHHDQA
jgi:hypothetical protein